MKNILDAVEGELSDWAAAKLKDRMMKSANWIVTGIQANILYQVVDFRKQHTVNLDNWTCTCCQWQFSGIPCGHAIAVSRFLKQRDCNHLVWYWFKTTTLKGTYQGLVYPVGESSEWEKPDGLQIVKPPGVIRKQSGRPKNKNRIASQGGVPTLVTCTRCWKVGHMRQSCMEPLPKRNVIELYSLIQNNIFCTVEYHCLNNVFSRKMWETQFGNNHRCWEIHFGNTHRWRAHLIREPQVGYIHQWRELRVGYNHQLMEHRVGYNPQWGEQ